MRKSIWAFLKIYIVNNLSGHNLMLVVRLTLKMCKQAPIIEYEWKQTKQIPANSWEMDQRVWYGFLNSL